MGMFDWLKPKKKKEKESILMILINKTEMHWYDRNMIVSIDEYNRYREFLIKNNIDNTNNTHINDDLYFQNWKLEIDKSELRDQKINSLLYKKPTLPEN